MRTSAPYASPSRFFRSSSNKLFTASTSPTAALPLCQSTTIGHFSAFAFWDASVTTPSASVGRLSTVGWAEMRTSGEGVDARPPGPVGDLEGRYERMVCSWSGVGGLFSITSRLKSKGGAVGFEGGYGEATAARSKRRAFVDAGDDGLWLLGIIRTEHYVLPCCNTYNIDSSGYMIRHHDQGECSNEF